MGGVTRLLVVDDDPLVRSALTLMLGGQLDLEVVGEAADGHEALRLVDGLSPDVVLMDIRMPRLNGLEATRRLHEAPDPPHVIVLTTFDADEHVVAALAAGADGFLLKDTPPAEIVESVRRVVAGDPMLSPSVTRQLISRVCDPRRRRAHNGRPHAARAPHGPRARGCPRGGLRAQQRRDRSRPAPVGPPR